MKRFLPAALACILLCGCGEDKPKLEQMLPSPTVTEKTLSTYTGTTVDFIHVETSPSYTQRRSDIDMPDFPEMPEFPEVEQADNPFGAEFEALFTYNTSSPETPTQDNAEYGSEISSETTTAFTQITADEAPMYNDAATVTAVVAFDEPSYESISADEYLNSSQAFSYPRMSEVTFEAETSETMDSYDIREFMPDDWGYDEFN